MCFVGHHTITTASGRDDNSVFAIHIFRERKLESYATGNGDNLNVVKQGTSPLFPHSSIILLDYY